MDFRDILVQTGSIGEEEGGGGGWLGRGGGDRTKKKHKEMASLEVETFTMTFSEAGMYE